MTPNQSHVAKWKAEQSPDAGWIVTDGNGNNWEEGGCTLAFLDEAKAEGFAYGLTSAQAKSAPAEPVSLEEVGLIVERDIMGTMHIKVGDFDFIQIQYQYPYTDNSGTWKLAERIAALLNGGKDE